MHGCSAVKTTKDNAHLSSPSRSIDSRHLAAGGGVPGRLAGGQRHKTPLHERTNRQRTHIDGEASLSLRDPTEKSVGPPSGGAGAIRELDPVGDARLAGGSLSLRLSHPSFVVHNRERHGVSLPSGDRSLRDRRVSGCPWRRLGRLTPCRSWGVSNRRDGFSTKERCPRWPQIPQPATRSGVSSTRSTSPAPHVSRWPRSSHSPAPARDPRGAACSGGCATTTVVRPCMADSRASRISCSVSGSTEAVASSKSRMGGSSSNRGRSTTAAAGLRRGGPHAPPPRCRTILGHLFDERLGTRDPRGSLDLWQ